MSSNDHRILAICFAVSVAILVVCAAAFGAGLTPRPPEYTPHDYLAASCAGGMGTDTTVFRFDLQGDIRWIEIYVEDQQPPGHQQLIAVASFAPGEEGPLLFAEVLLPSGQVVRFNSRDAIANSPYAEVCSIANLWLRRT